MPARDTFSQVTESTLGLIRAKLDFTREWKDDKSGKSTTFGEGYGKTVEKETTKHLVLSTMPPDVNHLVNKDRLWSTFPLLRGRVPRLVPQVRSSERAPANQPGGDGETRLVAAQSRHFYGK